MKKLFLLLCIAWHCNVLHSAEPIFYVSANYTSQNAHSLFPKALSKKGVTAVEKIYAQSHEAQNAYTAPHSPLRYESHAGGMRISGSTDPLSVLYLIKDSPQIIAGIIEEIAKLCDTSGKERHKKEAHCKESYLYQIDQDRAQLYASLPYEDAIIRDLVYLEERIQELAVATYTSTAPKGFYSAYCALEETLRDTHKALLQRCPRSTEEQLRADIRIIQHGLELIRKADCKHKKFKKTAIAEFEDDAQKAEQKLQHHLQEHATKRAVDQRIKQTQTKFNTERSALCTYCDEQQERAWQHYEDDPTWYERGTERIEALHTDSHQRVTATTYTLSAQAIADLRLYNLDTTIVEQITGNRFQHQLQSELVTIIEKATETRFTHYTYKEIVLTGAVSACAYNQAGESLSAMKITDLCWTLLDYGSAVIEGMGLGLCSALIHAATHPVETTLYAVAGPYMAAYQLTTVLYSVLDIGITHTYDPESAHQKWDEFTQPITDIYDALTDKETTTRDAIRTGTALATSLYAQAKLIGGLQKLCNSILQEISSWANAKIPRTPKDFLKTQDGYITVKTYPKNQEINGIRLTSDIYNDVVVNVRTGSALKADPYHAFSDIIDNYAGCAEKFDLVGNDGIKRALYQIKGSLNKMDGIFEWIVDPNPSKGVTHRLFIPKGTITGKPNMQIRS